jgi:hypothetical protein
MTSVLWPASRSLRSVSLFGISVMKLVQATREPHWDSPLQTKRR